MLNKHPYIPWLILYISANVIAGVIILDSKELLGDVLGYPLYSAGALVFALCLVVSSYFIILGPVFYFFSKIKVKPISWGMSEEQLGLKLGVIVLFIQIGFFIFNIVSGVNVAGSGNARSESVFSLLWVFVPADAIFLIYYGLYRESFFVRPNLVLYVISNVLRGWSSVFLFVAFVEISRRLRRRDFPFISLFLFVCIAVVVYPLISNLKWVVRSSSQAGLSWSVFFDGLTVVFDSADYFDVMSSSFMHLIGRLQSVSLVVEVMRLSEVLQQMFSNGRILPFWKEGLHGLIFDRIFGFEKINPIGVVFTEIDFPSGVFDVGDWNVSVGFVSWFFIAPHYIPLYMIYTLFLMMLGFYLLKKLGATDLSVDVFWLVCLMYLLAPWPAAFVGYLYALALFILMKKIACRRIAFYKLF